MTLIELEEWKRRNLINEQFWNNTPLFGVSRLNVQLDETAKKPKSQTIKTFNYQLAIELKKIGVLDDDCDLDKAFDLNNE